jgi:multiple sugar transport system permease protein
MASASATVPRRQKSSWRERREALNAYVFMSPVILGLLIFTLGPIIASLFLSFTNYNLLNDPKWIGVDNYVKMYGERLFWQSLKVSATYSLISVPLGMMLALFLAILLNRKMRGIYTLRSIYYLPTVISGVGVALLWRWIFNGQYGVLNTLLRNIGIKGPNWLLDENWALTALIITSVWGVGGTMLIFLAGLQGIPAEINEAAEIDGAGKWEQFRYITLPMISHVTFFNLVLGIIGALQVFTDAYVITGGGPNNSTLFIAVYLYRHAFQFLNFGYAAALAWVLFLIVMVLTIFVFRSSPLWVFYESERREK